MKRAPGILGAALALLALPIPIVTARADAAAGPATATATFSLRFNGTATDLTAKAEQALRVQLPQMLGAAAVRVDGYVRAPRQASWTRRVAQQRAVAVVRRLRMLGVDCPLQARGIGVPGSGRNSATANRVDVTITAPTTLLWSEEFDQETGTAVNPQQWSYLNGDGFAQLGLWNYGTGEIESNTATAALTDGQGHLAIRTSLQNGVWTSARIWTAQKLAFQYGTLEARIRFPVGSFNWPALWMLGADYQPPNRSFGTTPWPASGELDIAEPLLGNSEVRGTVHGAYPGTTLSWMRGEGISAAAPLADISGDFHTWGIHWLPRRIEFTLDGAVYGRVTFDGANVVQETPGARRVFPTFGEWPFDKPFLLILDNAIPAGTRAPDGTSSTMLVDWIRYSTFRGYGALSTN